MDPGSIYAVFAPLDTDRAGFKDDFLTRLDDDFLVAALDGVFTCDSSGDVGLKPPAAAAISAAL